MEMEMEEDGGGSEEEGEEGKFNGGEGVDRCVGGRFDMYMYHM